MHFTRSGGSSRTGSGGLRGLCSGWDASLAAAVWPEGGLAVVGLLTGSACLGDEALLWMLPWNGPQDRPSVRLRRARTHLCPSCRTCSSSSVGRDIRGVRSVSPGGRPALLPAQVQPTSVASALQKQSGGCRAEEGVLPCGLGLSYRDVGWCLLQGPGQPLWQDLSWRQWAAERRQ